MANWQLGKKHPPKAIGLGKAGSALAEMAIALPFFMILLLGVMDFSRVLWAAIGVTHAARAGAQYGVQHATMGDTALYAGMTTAANNVAADYGLTIPDPVPLRYCVPNCTPTSEIPIPPLYVSVTIPDYGFSTFTQGHFPGIPATVTLTREALIRVR